MKSQAPRRPSPHPHLPTIHIPFVALPLSASLSLSRVPFQSFISIFILNFLPRHCSYLGHIRDCCGFMKGGKNFYQINVKSTQDLMAFPAPSHEVDKPILEGKETASLAVLNQAGLAWSRAGQEGWWTEFAWYEIWMRCESSPWPCDVCMYMRFYSSPIIAVSTLNVIFIKEHLRNKLGYHLCYSS